MMPCHVTSHTRLSAFFRVAAEKLGSMGTRLGHSVTACKHKLYSWYAEVVLKMQSYTHKYSDFILGMYRTTIVCYITFVLLLNSEQAWRVSNVLLA